MSMGSMEGAVEAWERALTDTPEVLQGMVAAVREAGDAALALQVSLSHEKRNTRSMRGCPWTRRTAAMMQLISADENAFTGFVANFWGCHAGLAPTGAQRTHFETITRA